MNIEEEGKTYIKIKDRQEKSIIERNKVLEKLSKLEPLENEEYPIEEELEEVMKKNNELKLKLKEITKRIRKAIDDDEEDLLYVLFDIQDIIQDEEEQKQAYDKYIKPYIGDKENE